MKEVLITEDTIVVGRHDPSRADETPELSFDSDLSVSRSHARVVREGGRWFIEDLGSTHGTRLDGRKVVERVEIEPGTPIQTGKSAWTLMPAQWLCIRHGGVVVHGACQSSLHFAAVHCGTPLVGPLVVRNPTKLRSAALKLTLKVSGFSESCEIAVPPLEPGRQVRLGVPNFHYHVELLRNMTEPVRTQLSVLVNDESSVGAGREIEVLGFWDWSFEPANRSCLAAFTSPRNPIVERVVVEANKHLAGHEDFGSLLRRGRDDGEIRVLESLYRALSEEFKIHWIAPDTNGRKDSFQTIRPPHRIFPGGCDREAQGTCLDLAVLLAGCLENTGLCPVVVLMGEDDAHPDHAVAGCWASTVPGDRPVLFSADEIRRGVDTGSLILVESTGFARAAEKRLSFREAIKRAQQHIAEYHALCLVDIGALRPPLGSITPMDSPIEPEVGRAYDEARALAKAKKRELIETAHLFYGFLSADGEIIRWLLDASKLDPGELRAAFERQIPARSFEGEPVPTVKYMDCRRLAEDFAWQAGAPSVREIDLCWALLIKGRESTKLRRIGGTAGFDLEGLAGLLEKEFPRPGLNSSSLSISRGPEE